MRKEARSRVDDGNTSTLFPSSAISGCLVGLRSEAKDLAVSACLFFKMLGPGCLEHDLFLGSFDCKIKVIKAGFGGNDSFTYPFVVRIVAGGAFEF